MADEEQNVVNIFVTGVSMKGKSKLNKDDSDRPTEENQEQPEERKDGDSE
jgi:hypothetical protein